MTEQTRAGEVEAGVELRQRMARLIGGYQLSAAIGDVARLGVADALAAGPMGPQDLAAHVGADARSLERILRARSTTRGCSRSSTMAGSPSPPSASCCAVTRRCRRAVARSRPPRSGVGARTGISRRASGPANPASASRTGAGCGSTWPESPTPSRCLSSRCRVAAANAAAIVRTYDFSHVSRLVDVGGGHGVLDCEVLEANPHMHGVIFDLPGVIEGARTRVTEAGLTDRCELIAGDFFEAVPTGGDAYVLSWILHDWDDQSAARILANCRAAMRDGGRLLVIEMVIPSAEETPASPDLDRLVKASDREMLTIVGGRERTATEYRELYMNAGFELTRILALDSLPWSLIEGV